LEDRRLPEEAVRQRLSLVLLDDYRLPYPDHSIDFCFSDQVFEHVFNYERRSENSSAS